MSIILQLSLYICRYIAYGRLTASCDISSDHSSRLFIGVITRQVIARDLSSHGEPFFISWFCSQWVTQNPLHSAIWFVSFLTHRSMQSVFSEMALKLIRIRQYQCYVIDNNNWNVIENNNNRGSCVTNEPQRHLRTISWWTSTAGFPLVSVTTTVIWHLFFKGQWALTSKHRQREPRSPGTGSQHWWYYLHSWPGPLSSF